MNAVFKLHKSFQLLIKQGMGNFSFANFWSDVVFSLRYNKRQVWLCVALSAVGMVLGIVLFVLSRQNWWCVNRLQFVYKMVWGGFFDIFLIYLICAVVLSVLCWLFLLWGSTHFLCYFLEIFVGLYFGANCVAIFTEAGALGILYLVLLVAEQGLNMLSCFCAVTLPHQCRSPRQAFCDLQPTICLQSVGVVAKTVIIFVLFRIITAFI